MTSRAANLIQTTLVIAGFLLSGTATAQNPEIDTLIRAWVDGYNIADSVAVAHLYRGDALLLLDSGGLYSGPADVQLYLDGLRREGVAGITLDELSSAAQDGIGNATAILTLYGPAGEIVGAAVSLFRLTTDGAGWSITHQDLLGVLPEVMPYGGTP